MIKNIHICRTETKFPRCGRYTARGNCTFFDYVFMMVFHLPDLYRQYINAKRTMISISIT